MSDNWKTLVMFLTGAWAAFMIGIYAINRDISNLQNSVNTLAEQVRK